MPCISFPPDSPPFGGATASLLVWWLGLAMIVTPAQSAETAADVERVVLETSDGVDLATWYYPPPEDVQPLATVILVHDFDGSHKTVEPLARALQTAGCAVATPDLRGHGSSTSQAGREGDLDIRQMRKADLELMAAGAGGRLRAQSAVRGDLETVHAFLVSRATSAGSAADRVAVIGCGAGGTLAALWTAADWAWPPLASGPQGQQVKALVLVSPTWAAKGLSLQPALASEALKREVPIMVVAGTADRDAIRLFDQLKRQRPREWFDQRAGAEVARAKEVEQAGDATLFLVQLDTTLSSEKLLRDAETGAASRIRTFLELMLGGDRDR